MKKELCFLVCVVLFCCGTARAAPIPIDYPGHNLSFEFHWPDVNDANGYQIYGHTGIDAAPRPSPDDVNEGVWRWFVNGSGFKGVDVFCPFAYDSLTHCHQFPATDGICFIYLAHANNGIENVLDDVNDPNATIMAGRQYTMKWDALDMGKTGARAELYSASVDPLATSLWILPEIWQPEENCDAGATTLESNCVDFHRDLEISFIALEGDASLGEALSVRVEAGGGGGNYVFGDNVRLEWMWLTPAYYPSPEDGEEDVAQSETLFWSAGLWDQQPLGHEVYFGTSFDEVDNADNTLPVGTSAYRGAQNRDVNTYSPTEIPYVLGKTYYWRVDEVNDNFNGPPAAAPDANNRWRGDVWSFEVTGFATNPSPEDRATDVSLYADLSWSPGTSSESHDIYFGTDFNDVVAGTNSLPVGTSVYKGEQGPNSYDPGILNLSETYYWRIDELRNSGADVIKGKIWSFTVASFMMIDDMESYETGVNNIYSTWVQTPRASINLETGDANYTQDAQSMEFRFDNDNSPYSSKTERTFSSAQNWMAAGFEVLALSLRASMNNDGNAIQPMYVFASDGTNTGTVEYDDPNDLIRGWLGWQEWNIDLQDFVDDNSVNLGAITSMGIIIGDGSAAGDAYVYIDDIKLYPMRCVVDKAVAGGNFTSDDCDIDMFDFAALGRDWLLSGIGSVTASAPSDANLYGHWTLDDNAGNAIVLDSSVNNNHGSFYNSMTGGQDPVSKAGKTSAAHVDVPPGFEGTGAFLLDGIDDFVKIPAMNVYSNTMTMTAWIKRDSAVPGHIYDGIVFSSNTYDACDPNYTAGLQFGSDRDTWETNYALSYMWTGYSWEWDSGLFVPPDEWTFVALTVAPDVGTLYLLDGIAMQASRNYDTHDAKPWNAPFHIADQMQFGPPGKSDRFFPGMIDDVRIYDCTLTHEEVLSLALQGSAGSWFQLLEPWRANADDTDDVVDGYDLEIVSDNWLTEVLWP